MEEQEEKKTVYFDLSPLGAGKRMLSGLADFFTSFILGVFLFAIVAFPSMQRITGYDASVKREQEASRSVLDVLYAHSLLYYGGEEKDYDFDKDIEYTGKQFVLSHLSSLDVPKEKNPVYMYWVRERNDQDQLIEEYKEKDQDTSFFTSDTDGDGIPVLKEEYQEEFLPLSQEGNSLSAKGQEDYHTLVTSVFLSLYGDVIYQIERYDYENGTELSGYQENRNLADQIRTERWTNVSITAFAVYFFSVFVTSVLVPLLNRRGRTPGMIFLREDRIGVSSLKPVPKANAVLLGLTDFVFDLPYLMFLPMADVMFTALFGLPYLFALSLLGLLFDAVSGGFALFTSYHQTLKDKVSLTALVRTEDLEKALSLQGGHL